MHFLTIAHENGPPTVGTTTGADANRGSDPTSRVGEDPQAAEVGLSEGHDVKVRSGGGVLGELSSTGPTAVDVPHRSMCCQQRPEDAAISDNDHNQGDAEEDHVGLNGSGVWCVFSVRRGGGKGEPFPSYLPRRRSVHFSYAVRAGGPPAAGTTYGANANGVDDLTSLESEDQPVAEVGAFEDHDINSWSGRRDRRWGLSRVAGYRPLPEGASIPGDDPGANETSGSRRFQRHESDTSDSTRSQGRPGCQ